MLEVLPDVVECCGEACTSSFTWNSRISMKSAWIRSKRHSCCKFVGKFHLSFFNRNWTHVAVKAWAYELLDIFTWFDSCKVQIFSNIGYYNTYAGRFTRNGLFDVFMSVWEKESVCVWRFDSVHIPALNSSIFWQNTDYRFQFKLFQTVECRPWFYTNICVMKIKFVKSDKACKFWTCTLMENIIMCNKERNGLLYLFWIPIALFL